MFIGLYYVQLLAVCNMVGLNPVSLTLTTILCIYYLLSELRLRPLPSVFHTLRIWHLAKSNKTFYYIGQ